ncbi:MAG: NAD-dependent epimerase/dehydratase family protein [Chloroflexota bacterium]|nr:NAD-dependent epimerase/dehydratase family protein [Chloroflexota bacterium]
MFARRRPPMREKITLITGANGEVGHGLIEHLSASRGASDVVVLDLRGLDEAMRSKVNRVIIGDILDNELINLLLNEYEIDTIIHLAALLSTHSEFNPETAHRVNVQGTLNLLKLAIEQGKSRGQPIKFLFPSSIAVYGMPDAETKQRAGAVNEHEYLYPTTMYGCNKLYCEHLGRYYAQYYQQLSATPSMGVDFRCVRFPGLISAQTMPTGGTSDFAPEMLHAAVQGKHYACFVSEDAQIPFMVMPDAIKSLLMLADAPQTALKHYVYNVSSFTLSAGDVAERVRRSFPQAQIEFEPDTARQAIVDSWPLDVDDAAARAEWGWSPDYDATRAFDKYLIPTIRGIYGG